MTDPEKIYWDKPRNYDTSFDLQLATNNFVIYRNQLFPHLKCFLIKKTSLYGTFENIDLNTTYVAYFTLYDSNGLMMFRKPALVRPETPLEKGVIEYWWSTEDTREAGTFFGSFDFVPITGIPESGDINSVRRPFTVPKGQKIRITIK